MALSLAFAATFGFAQLTTTDNRLWDENDFDNAAESNRFGAALAVCDFDGDGFDDLAIGSPGADFLGVLDNAGAVHVAYGGPSGLVTAGHQTLTQPPTGADPPEVSDIFGTALTGADFDGDGRCDLAVGAPGDSVGGSSAAGTVHVFAGAPGGLLSSSQVWHQDRPGIASGPAFLERFGRTLVAADFDGDGFDDLVIGVRNEGGGVVLGFGAVHVIYGTAEGLSALDSDFIHQGDAAGTLGTPLLHEGFGQSLAVGRFNGDAFPDLAVSVPFEDLAGIDDAGQVHLFYADRDGFLNRGVRQDLFDQGDLGLAAEVSDLFGTALASGDFDGDGLDDLAVGSLEGVGPLGAEETSAGSVAILSAETDGLTAADMRFFTQDTDGVSDTPESNDTFGAALAAGDFDADGDADLGIGVPFEDFEGGGFTNNGALHALYGTTAGLGTVGEQFHGQGVWGPGATEDNDNFGAVLAAGDFDGDGVEALVVGVPEEDRAAGMNAGVVVVITGEPTPVIFADGFESGDLGAWSAAVP